MREKKFPGGKITKMQEPVISTSGRGTRLDDLTGHEHLTSHPKVSTRGSLKM